jgi:hypothetical protein
MEVGLFHLCSYDRFDRSSGNSSRSIRRTAEVRHSRRRLRYDDTREQQISRDLESECDSGCCLHRLGPNVMA